MENHIKHLEKLCRICAHKVVKNKGYIHPKTVYDFQDTIMELFSINIALESSEVYPKMLCITCKKKFDLYLKNGTSSSSFVPALFQEHTSNCKLCLQVYVKPKGSFLKKLEQSLLAIDYVKFKDLQDDCRIYYKPYFYKHGISCDISLVVRSDYTWQLIVMGEEIKFVESCLPNPLQLENHHLLIDFLRKSHICVANEDFLDVIDKKLEYKEPFPGSLNERTAYIECSKGKVKLDKTNFDTIRHVQCQLLLESPGRCEKCKELRKQLHTIRTRSCTVEKVSDSSKVNDRFLTNEELIKKIEILQKQKKKVTRQSNNLAIKMSESIKEQGVILNNSHANQLEEIIKTEEPDFGEDTPMSLLWEQQKEQLLKHPNGIRWHPLIIRWCLSIYHTSPAAYKQISSKRNKFLVLPHINTLKKYINYTSPVSGFNVDSIEKLIVDSKLATLEDYQKNISLSFDEMKIQSGLVYKKSSGKLVGFTEMGEVNEEIQYLQNEAKNKNEENFGKQLAQYVNVFMIRGIFSNLECSIGYYASEGFTGDQLLPIVWEATRVMESIGFKVRNWVCDGASPNRNFFAINDLEEVNERKQYWTINRYAPDRKIFFISDVPHLVKTTRNNLENSHGNSNTRNLHQNKQDISWNHIVSVYEEDLGMQRIAPGLRKLVKLREEHIKLSPRDRMRVKLAAQIMSTSVANALSFQGKFYTKSTENFCRIFDRAFDCLNVSKVSWKGKDDLKPYKSPDDPRFKFLKSVLTYLDEWRAEANSNEHMTKQEKSRLCLSIQTENGWHITISSFLELAQTLMNEYKERGIYLLSEKLNQDPLEEHFGKHRRSGGCSDNPTYLTFQTQQVSLGLIDSDLISDFMGNTSGRRPDTRPPLKRIDTRLPMKKKKTE